MQKTKYFPDQIERIMRLNQIDYRIVQNQPLSSAGFTLLELLVTITIAGVLIALAIPSFISVIQNNRLTTQTNELVTAMNLARSESVKRGYNVMVEKIGASGWEGGWQVYMDSDNNNAFSDDGDANLCEPAAGTSVPEDCLFRVFPALPRDYTLRGNSTVPNYIFFKPTGDANAQGSFVVCDNSDHNNLPEANTSRLIIVNPTGRVRIAVDSDNDGIPNTGSSGANITTCTP